MSRRNLRSTTTLSGDIQKYLLENRSDHCDISNMPDEGDNSNLSSELQDNASERPEDSDRSSALNNMQNMVNSLSGDPTKLCELLVQNLTMATESIKQTDAEIIAR